MKNLDFINALNYVEYVFKKEMESSRSINQNPIILTCTIFASKYFMRYLDLVAELSLFLK